MQWAKTKCNGLKPNAILGLKSTKIVFENNDFLKIKTILGNFKLAILGRILRIF